MSHEDRPCPPPESAPPVKKEDPRQRATVSFLGLLHYRLPPTILSPYSGEKKKSLSLSLRLSLSRREDRKFLIRYSIPLEDRSSADSNVPISPVPLAASQGDEQMRGRGIVAIVRGLLSKQRPNIAGTRRLNERQRTRGILVKINIIATGVTGCVSRRGGARVDIDTGNTPAYWVSGSKVG